MQLFLHPVFLYHRERPEKATDMKYIPYLVMSLICGLTFIHAEAQSYREVKLHVSHHEDGRIYEADSIFVVRDLDELNDILQDLGLRNSSSVKTQIEERRHTTNAGTGRPMVGVYLSNRSDGLYISSVTKNGAAATAGLRAGDKILYMNGTRIRREHDLIETKNKYRPGDRIVVEYERDGRDYETEVILKGERSVSSLKAYLGVVSSDHRGQGTYLTQVVDNTPAQRAELKVGDVIWEMDGHRISDSDDLTDALAKHTPGDRVVIKFSRGDRDFETWTNLASRGSTGQQSRTIKVPSDKPFLGINMADHNDNGVKISSVVRGSSAERYGLRQGDIILIMDRDYIRDTDDLSAALKRYRPGQEITIEIEREGRVERKDVRLGAKESSRTLKVDPSAYYEVRADVYEDEAPRPRTNNGGWEGSSNWNSITPERTDRTSLAPKVFEYFPNPNNGRFRLVFELPSQEQVKIRIYDQDEREIYRERITGFDGVYDETIDISRDLSPGTYTLEVSQSGRKLAKQIVVD